MQKFAIRMFALETYSVLKVHCSFNTKIQNFRGGCLRYKPKACLQFTMPTTQRYLYYGRRAFYEFAFGRTHHTHPLLWTAYVGASGCDLVCYGRRTWVQPPRPRFYEVAPIMCYGKRAWVQSGGTSFFTRSHPVAPVICYGRRSWVRPGLVVGGRSQSHPSLVMEGTRECNRVRPRFFTRSHPLCVMEGVRVRGCNAARPLYFRGRTQESVPRTTFVLENSISEALPLGEHPTYCMCLYFYSKTACYAGVCTIRLPLQYQRI